jgi:hypothetical protein
VRQENDRRFDRGGHYQNERDETAQIAGAKQREKWNFDLDPGAYLFPTGRYYQHITSGRFRLCAPRGGGWKYAKAAIPIPPHTTSLGNSREVIRDRTCT